MEYVIKIGKNYIGVRNGAYTEVHRIEDAYRGNSYHKLSNVLNNCVSPDKRKQCKITEVKFPSVIKAPVSSIEIKTNTQTPSSSSFNEVVTKLKAVGSLGFKDELDELYKKESLIDQEICDIYHYIEFSNFNAAGGYKAYKMLKEALLRRREIKDEITKYKMINDLTIGGIFDGTLDKKLNDFDNRTYTPRVLKHLFE